jgi:hypothetical protein
MMVPNCYAFRSYILACSAAKRINKMYPHCPLAVLGHCRLTWQAIPPPNAATSSQVSAAAAAQKAGLQKSSVKDTHKPNWGRACTSKSVHLQRNSHKTDTSHLNIAH